MELKVGIFNDSFPPTIDGVANTAINYAANIQKSHGESIVVTPKYPNVTDHYPFEVYRYLSIPIAGPLAYRVGNPFSPLTISELRSRKMDIIHVHSPFSSSLLAKQLVAVKSHRVPVVFTYHTKFEFDIAKYVGNSHLQKMAQNFVTYNIKQADEVWAVSEGAGESLRTIGYKGPYQVMPNGTDFKKGTAPKEETDEIKRIYNIKPSETIFLFIGRMMWYKNIKIILDSLDIVNKAGIPFRAFFLGDGNDRASMEQYAASLDLQSITHFTGAIYDRERVRAYCSLADLFLFPSTYDTSGLVVKEAAACSCPSLLVTGSCAAEGVEDNVSGFLAEENAESCATRIIEAIRQPGLLKKVGDNACDMLYLSWEDAVAKAYRRYEEIISKWPYPLPNLYKKR